MGLFRSLKKPSSLLFAWAKNNGEGSRAVRRQHPVLPVLARPAGGVYCRLADGGGVNPIKVVL